MNRIERHFPQLSTFTDRLTAGTGGRLARALVHVLRGHRQQTSSHLLESAVRDASRELRVVGLADHAVLAFLSDFVEDAGRACGADSPSLVSGQLRWMPVRTRVLEFATAALLHDAALCGASA